MRASQRRRLARRRLLAARHTLQAATGGAAAGAVVGQLPRVPWAQMGASGRPLSLASAQQLPHSNVERIASAGGSQPTAAPPAPLCMMQRTPAHAASGLLATAIIFRGQRSSAKFRERSTSKQTQTAGISSAGGRPLLRRAACRAHRQFGRGVAGWLSRRAHSYPFIAAAVLHTAPHRGIIIMRRLQLHHLRRCWAAPAGAPGACWGARPKLSSSALTARCGRP